MASCLALIQPGRWRAAILIAGLSLAIAPAVPLSLAALSEPLAQSGIGAAFVPALLRGAEVALLTTVLSFVLGLPTGLLLGLHDFPLRRLLAVTISLLLVLPPFLLAIGLSMLAGTLGMSAILSGVLGTAWSLAPAGVALVTFITYGATRSITRSQVNASRLGGGEMAVLRDSARSVWPTSALGASFAGVLALSEAGPGLIFGHHGAGSEILASFSAQYDFSQAARQCLLLAAAVSVVALPTAMKLAPLIAIGLLARDIDPAEPRLTGWHIAESFAATMLMIAILGLALIGLLLPVTRELPLARAVSEVTRTLGDTAVYALAAAMVAIVAGFALAIAAGRTPRVQVILIAALLLLLALPPSFTALGWILLANDTPPALDFIMRDRPLLALHLGVHALPIATLFALRAINSAAPSWAEAAGLHGVGVSTYLCRVLLPWSAPVLLVGAGLIVLLATADIPSALLLHAPGKGTVPLTIYAVMANAPEAYVATLCLLYVLGSALLVLLCLAVVRRWR